MTYSKTQTGWAFSLPDSLFRLTLLFSIAFNVLAYEVAPNDKFGQYCLDKADYARSIVLGRSDPGEHHAEMREILSELEKVWREHDTYPVHAYVDMQAVVRRAYRMSNGNYRLQDEEEFADKIFSECLGQGF